MNWAWNSAGIVFVGLGLVGTVVPGMPTTVFLILALGCFTKAGNQKLRAWLLRMPKFGEILEEWEREKAIPLWVKRISCACIVGFTALSMFVISLLWVKLVVLAVAIAGIWYILAQKTSRTVLDGGEREPVANETLDLAS